MTPDFLLRENSNASQIHSFIKHKNGAHYIAHTGELIPASTGWQLTMGHGIPSSLHISPHLILSTLPWGSCQQYAIHLTGEETKALEGKINKTREPVRDRLTISNQPVWL